MAADQKPIKDAIKRIKSALTRHTNYVNAFTDSQNISLIESRVADITSLFKEYDERQSEIETILYEATTDEEECAALEAKFYKERDAVECQYYALISKIKSILAKASPGTSSSVPPQGHTGSTIININETSSSKSSSDVTILKPLQLPMFSGKYSEWFMFYDSFESLVHKDQKLSDIQKFHYLRGCLSGDALRSVESLSVSSANYSSALELLKKRFENKRLIVQEHLKNILNIPSIQRTSHSELRQLMDNINNSLEALKILELPIESWDSLLIVIISEKLDFATKRDWHASLDKALPTFESFKEFLERRCQVLEATSNLKPQFTNCSNSQKNVSHFKTQTSAQTKPIKPVTNTVTSAKCYLCQAGHKIYQCKQFLELPIVERLNQVQKLKICKNCLRMHPTESCNISSSCKRCNSKHHTLLHITDFVPTQPASSLIISNSNLVLLSTALVLIKDNNGNYQTCRAVLDQCSEVCLISMRLLKRLKLPSTNVETTISGVNISDNISNKSVNVQVKSRFNDFTASFKCFVLPTITRETPLVSFAVSKLEISPNMKLADPSFNVSTNVDLLIGAQLFWSLLIGGPLQLQKEGPYFQETQLGWIVGGPLLFNNSSVDNNSCYSVSLVSISPNDNLESQVAKFWKYEDIGDNMDDDSIWSNEHLMCESHFIENVTRAPNGQFIVCLPFKENVKQLQCSREMAFKHFMALERRLNKNPKLKAQYQDFMNQYERLDHMELVPFKEMENKNTFYLPHFAVFKNSMEGPKIRVVFNASAKTKDTMSLNDTLMTGMTLQQDLFSILCRFRTYTYAISADIVKMYRMILVHPQDRDFQRIFWRANDSEPLNIFRLKTVTYGTTCAPFLAVRSLHQLALENADRFPRASKIIQQDFYMDDLLTGTNSLEEAQAIKEDIVAILESAKFVLSKWASNSSELVPRNDLNLQLINMNKDSSEDNHDIKVLGFHWNVTTDELTYKVTLPHIVDPKQLTKRSILSMVARIFDPLGLVNPVVVKAKIFIQHIWTLKLNWDLPVPEDINKFWIDFANDLQHLNSFQINRCVNAQQPVNVQLHCFSDASTKAYGTCIYLRVVNASNHISVNLLCARSRVAPLKKITLPRLELSAAVLMIELAKKVSEILNMEIDERFYWTDSTIVLHWIAADCNTWKRFIANRVSQIQKYSSFHEWHHVKSDNNPADLVSRGTSPQILKASPLWWQGPQCLAEPPEYWQKSSFKILDVKDENITKEIKISNVVNIIASEPELPIFSKFSSFCKLKRVFAYLLRFINNSKGKDRLSGLLSVNELDNAEMQILKYIQKNAFSSFFNDIDNNVHKKLLSLDPFIDSHGLLRVGGRIKQAPLHFDNKFPILLPQKHHITRLIIREVHEKEYHAGNAATLAMVRQKYWPLSGRNEVRKIVHGCFKCNRVHPKISMQKMGDLPKERVQPSRPFNISGVDYAGPFLIKESKLRSSRVGKAYIALFICFATKALHLELVRELTSDNFLAALKRFTSRRGNVSEIFSDNGTNFIGAERELIRAQLFQNSVVNKMASTGTKFHFIPARSPHFGGLWERAVKSVKSHLHKVVGNYTLTYEEFYTVLTGIEACMNSRPLTPLSDDPNDLDALTPGHFLIGTPITAPVEPDLSTLNPNRLSRWQRVQQIQQHFWNRWQKEYLTQLQQRPKGYRKTHVNIKLGALVVLKDEILPPLKWRMGRVVDVFPGKDGLVRVVAVKTSSGVLKRAVKKVCLLPTDVEND